MIYRVEVSATALADLDSLALWIARDNRASAESLFERVACQLEQLTRFPRTGARYEHRTRTQTEIRFAPVPGFPAILLYYDVSDETETITIRRLLDGRRDLR
ncbi:MAG: type II toxin-antitoxin system RelE/ParE family toxin [Bryobacterales bacterium]|nr:type II toxin-antitoxin system RelE/ParE family toxin [Acidobacteriota bacterium]MCB9385456.1 type II toxin-antitoxin system RelE/ParE family toxin [Bryobacterales bacterium]